MVSLMEIQAEQERERNTHSNQNQLPPSGRRSSGGSNRGYGGGGGGNYNRSNSSQSNRRGSNHSRRGSRDGRSDLPLERGCICSLKEKFGFIHCADRPAEIFFHYSEVSNVHADDLNLDDEVEFRVGMSRDNPDKLAALEVCQLAPGTIEWEYEESPGERFQGLIDRPLMRSNPNTMRRSGSSNDLSEGEGLIRLLVPADEEKGPGQTKNDDAVESTEAKKAGTTDTMTTADGPKIRFSTNDYNPEGAENNNGDGNPTKILQRKNSASSIGSTTGRLYRGDLVEFTLVTEKRTRQKFARNIVLLQSERERARLAKEKQMLANATLEQGVVVSLKDGFGFLRSNARRDEVYFHYSNIELPEGEGEVGKEDDHELTMGQEMEFLVVTEDVEDRNNNTRKQKTSARKVKFLPKGSVLFEKVIKEGVAGVVSFPPRADAGRNQQKERDPQSMGSIRLINPITTADPKSKDADAPTASVSSVLLHVSDSPGGIFTCSKGTSMGLWIREGDTLLFDVVYDFVDGAYYAKPTKHLVPAGSAAVIESAAPEKVVEGKENASVNGDANKKEEDNGNAEESEKDAVDNDSNGGSNKNSNGNNKKKNKNQRNPSSGAAVRMIGLCLAGRAEGVVHTIKEAYGFVHYSERPVDAHFKNFELLPDEVQEDLRRNMDLSIKSTTKADMMGMHKLSVGTEVQFDISVHGTVMTQNQHPNRGNKRGAGSNQHERENLKAQRLLILPKGTILQQKPLGLGVKGVITKEDPNQPYAGTLELQEELPQMTLEERHPLVVKMIDEFLKDEDHESLVVHDIQSSKEEDVISDIIEVKGQGKLECTHIPQASESNYPGRLCIRKVSGDAAKKQEEEADLAPVDAVTADGEEEAKELGEGEASPGTAERVRSKSPMARTRSKSPKKERAKKKKALQLKLQPIKDIRFDKSSLTQDSKLDVPPGEGDVITCDVHQIRRTGKINLENLRVVERKLLDPAEAAALEGVSGTGVVREVVIASKFGFIAVFDETASKRELLFFHFASITNPHSASQQQQQTQQGRNRKGGAGSADAVIHKGDEVKFKVGTENGKRVAVDINITASATIPNKVEKNACRGYILVEPTDTKVGSPIKPSRSFTRSRDTPPQHHNSGGRWDHVKDDDLKKDKLSSKGEGVILLLEDPADTFAAHIQETMKLEKKKGEDGKQAPSSAAGLGKFHLHYQNGALALQGAGAPTAMDSSTNPRRGDLVSFVKSRNNNHGVRDIRVVTRAAATFVRGHLEGVDHIKGTAKFVGNVNGDKKEFDIELKEVVSCDTNQLKNKIEVEGVWHDNAVHGLCRTTDLRLESKLGTGRKERPRLNLTVKKDRAGTIMAQSMMAKGPDKNSTGFTPGWTKRVSKYAQAN